MIWREKKWLVGSAALLLLLNVFFFLTYRVRYEDRVSELRARKDAAQAELAEAKRQRMTAENSLTAFNDIERGVRTVYDEWWSTPDERLTKIIVEIRSLAAKSGLKPMSVSYETTATDSAKVVSGQARAAEATTMGIGFSVSGSYAQIRRLIHLLEMSDEFVVIDSIALGGSGDASTQVTLSIHLKTLFRGEPLPATSRL